MSANSAAERGRQAAERIMTDACRIYRLAGTGGTLNTTTGRVDRTQTDLYVGKCRVKAETGTSVGDIGVGESSVSRVTPVVSVPMSVATATVRAGDRVEMTATPDPHLAGRHLLIRAVQSGTHITAHRLICEVLDQ